MNSVRAAFHVHSLWSDDGARSLSSIVRSFGRLRCSVVFMSEHDRGFNATRWRDYQEACAEASNDRVLLVPGIEYEDSDGVVHLPTWGEGLPFFGSARAPLDLLRDASDAGAFTVLAHPWRRDAIARYLPEWAPLLGGIEIWNRKYDGIAPHPSAREVAERESLTPFASLDFHTGRQLFPLAMRVDAPAAPTLEALLTALREGRTRPEVLGIPVLSLTDGAAGLALRRLERLRRALRPVFSPAAAQIGARG